MALKGVSIGDFISVPTHSSYQLAVICNWSVNGMSHMTFLLDM